MYIDYAKNDEAHTILKGGNCDDRYSLSLEVNINSNHLKIY